MGAADGEVRHACAGAPPRDRPLRLVVVPNDPIHLYEQAGYDNLREYFNPTALFGEVVVLSPLEPEPRHAFGMEICPVEEAAFGRALAARRPDVVRAYAGDWPSDLVCRHRLAGVPVVVSVHDRSRARMHESLRYADMVICVSDAVADEVVASGVDPARVRLLPNRVDTAVFRPVHDAAALAAIDRRVPPGRHLLHIGRKVEEKNLDTVIRALALLGPDYSCVFIGLGDAAPFRRLAAELGVTARCVWIDAVKNSELPAWYSWCDCFCVPSRSEGFGTVFIEAAACGAAIVTSDLPPMNRYLADGDSACLVKEFTSAEALAASVRRVCTDEAYRRRLREGARRAAARFDRTRVEAEEAELYREALSLPAPPLARRAAIARWKLRAAVEPRLLRLRSAVRGRLACA